MSISQTHMPSKEKAKVLHPRTRIRRERRGHVCVGVRWVGRDRENELPRTFV